MSKKVVILKGGLFLCLVLVVGCGSGTATSTTDSGTGSGAVTEINSISDIPTSVIDPSEYDLSTNSALQQSLSPQPSLKTKAVAAFSRAGCETDRMKRNVIRSALVPKMVLCFMQAFEVAAGGNAAGDGVFNLWKGSDNMSEGGGPSGVDEFKPRMAIKKSGTDLTFVMCNDTTKAMELVISTANNQYSGHVIDKWGDGHQGRLQFLTDGLPTTAAGAVGFTTASFTQEMVEASAFWNGFGSETLEATPSYNTVYGYYNEGGDNDYAGSVYARFDNTQGTARYFQVNEGSYPSWTLQAVFDNCEVQSGAGQCGDFQIDWLSGSGWLVNECSLSGVSASTQVCFPNDCQDGDVCCPYEAGAGEDCTSPAGEDNIESFTITLLDAATNSLGFGVAGTSNFAAAVAAATMPDSSAQPTIEFTTASAGVDCSTSNTWTEMSFTSEPDMSDCEDIENELDDWDTGDLCQLQDATAAAGATGGAQ